jgi:hypothetical protein
MTTGDWILLVVYLFGILGLGWWIKILKGAVDAQRKTIEAQGTILTEFKDLSATMKGVLESTDEPKMLERVKAYKEFVDREKEAAITELGKKSEQGFRMTIEAIKGLISGQIEVFSNLVSYVPVELRRRIIDSLRLEGNPPELKDGFHKLAEGAIDLSSPEKRTGLGGLLLRGIFPEGPPKQTSGTFEPGAKLKERLTGKRGEE